MKNIISTILSFSLLFSCSKKEIDSKPEIENPIENPIEDSDIELSLNYVIVDSKQTLFFNNTSEISEPSEGSAFYGQDAQFTINPPSYSSNSDGTVNDNNTGLIWEKGYKRLTHSGALAYLEEKNKGQYSDWRIPSIKEIYSLMQFSGTDVSSNDMTSVPPSNAIAFIDQDYFDFDYFANGDRAIDVQYYTTSKYTGLVMGKSEALFGLNVADGRIKGYPYISRGAEKEFIVKLVRSNTNYAKNEFVEGSNNTIIDKATGLMWDKDDSNQAMNWSEALLWAQEMNTINYRGYNDWRVPNAKELHSIVDYSRSPQATNSAAIDPIFNISKINVEGGLEDYPFFWTSTTHQNLNVGAWAVYICFGSSYGYFPDASSTPIDVHGAGAQRGDPKVDDGKDYSSGHGPQGDVVRINNYVRLVRTIKQ